MFGSRTICFFWFLTDYLRAFYCIAPVSTVLHGFKLEIHRKSPNNATIVKLYLYIHHYVLALLSQFLEKKIYLQMVYKVKSKNILFCGFT